ncbi:hypothetical protein EJ04DRAFT_582604 [Polyplosphaeria fusca]|uniref:Uncharacterized protein n=1 Tax=Polyplosphaeria fusca TaxID=682080 RepID=A0A9P4USA7_9PLEO|nr:hypothetical protein EJ04DRAFT_582604 [Polyplosphaeria fusca]
MNTQRQSRLLSLPAELQQAIYVLCIPDRIHICLQQGKLQWFTCALAVSDEEYLDGSERNPGEGAQSEPLWARRLASSWGSHWNCEEIAYTRPHGGGDPLLSLLLVCKEMFFGIKDAISGNTIVALTDLETLGFLAKRSKETQTHNRDQNFSIMPNLLPRVVELNITLWLPLANLRSLEEQENSSLATESTNMWQQLHSMLACFKHLQMLHLWLDHDDPCFWHTMNERAILSTFISERAPDCKISLSLPKLHPWYEDPHRHYLNDADLPATVHLQRRMRQWHFGRNDAQGLPVLEFKADFPILLGLPDMEGFDKKRTEAIERGMWESGEDVERTMMRWSGIVCEYTDI